MSQFDSASRSHYHYHGQQGRGACADTRVQHSYGRPSTSTYTKPFHPNDPTRSPYHQPFSPPPWHSNQASLPNPQTHMMSTDLQDNVPSAPPNRASPSLRAPPRSIHGRPLPAAVPPGAGQVFPTLPSHPQMQHPPGNYQTAARGGKCYNAWSHGFQRQQGHPGFRGAVPMRGSPLGHTSQPAQMSTFQGTGLNGNHQSHLNGEMHSHPPQPAQQESFQGRPLVLHPDFYYSRHSQSTGTQPAPIPRQATLAELKGEAMWDLESQPSGACGWDDCSPGPDDGSEFGYRYMDPTWQQRVLTWLNGVTEEIQLDKAGGPVNVLSDPPDDVWSMAGAEEFFLEFNNADRDSSGDQEDGAAGAQDGAQPGDRRQSGQGKKHSAERPQGRGKYFDGAPVPTAPGAKAPAKNKKKRRGKAKNAPPKPEPRAVFRDGEVVYDDGSDGNNEEK